MQVKARQEACMSCTAQQLSVVTMLPSVPVAKPCQDWLRTLLWD